MIGLMRTLRAMTGLSAAIVIATTSAGCLLRTEEDPEEGDPPGVLTAGSIRLRDYPVNTTGISGLSAFCRALYDCGCPILSPENVAWCREEIWNYTEQDCSSILANAVPQCLPDY